MATDHGGKACTTIDLPIAHRMLCGAPSSLSNSPLLSASSTTTSTDREEEEGDDAGEPGFTRVPVPVPVPVAEPDVAAAAVTACRRPAAAASESMPGRMASSSGTTWREGKGDGRNKMDGKLEGRCR